MLRARHDKVAILEPGTFLFRPLETGFGQNVGKTIPRKGSVLLKRCRDIAVVEAAAFQTFPDSPVILVDAITEMERISELAPWPAISFVINLEFLLKLRVLTPAYVTEVDSQIFSDPLVVVHL